jgi:hypothetical protein
LFLQKSKANQKAQKPHTLLPKSSFYYNTISKVHIPSLSLAFGWITLRKLPTVIGYEKDKNWFDLFLPPSSTRRLHP